MNVIPKELQPNYLEPMGGNKSQSAFICNFICPEANLTMRNKG